MKAIVSMNQRMVDSTSPGSDDNLDAMPGLCKDKQTMDRMRMARGIFCHTLTLLLVSVLMPPVAIAGTSERDSSLQDEMEVRQDSISSELSGQQIAQTSRQLAARTDSADIPKNAHAKSYTSGWECDQNFREADGACAAISVPKNAFPTNTTYGRGWECYRGFRTAEDACNAIEIPANAYINSSGSNWVCDRGYRKDDEKCISVTVPLNAYLNPSRDDGWSCERGYRPDYEACTAIELPTNGYLTNTPYSTGWECERGYRAVDGACTAINVPANGYLSDSSYGLGWDCARGYQASDSACVAVKLPENAHLDFSGNNWDCDRPYRKQKDTCVLL